MPADRQIIVKVESPGHRAHGGVWVPGTKTSIRTWAYKHDLSLTELVETEGTRDAANRRWRVRYDSRIYNSPTSMLEVADGALTFKVTHINEITDQGGNRQPLRRRFIDISGVHST